MRYQHSRSTYAGLFILRSVVDSFHYETGRADYGRTNVSGTESHQCSKKGCEPLSHHH